jgi:hypothetical protein
VIVWSGRGVAAFAFAAGSFLIGGLLGGLFHTASAGTALSGLGLVIGGLLTWRFGKKWNSEPGRTLVDPATSQTVTLRPSHTLFFVPMQWWAVPMVGGGALMVLVGLLEAGGILPPN